MSTSIRRGFVQALALLAIAGLLVFAACKKDEPKPGAPAAGEPAVEKAQAPAEKPAAEKPQAPAEKPAAPAVPVAPAEIKPVPADVAVYGAVQSFDALTKLIDGVVAKVNPMPGIGMMMMQAIQGGLGMASMTWLDTTQPVQVVVLSPKRFSQPAVIILPTKGAESLKAALPETRKEGDQGNAFSYTANGQTFFINLMGERMALTLDATVFAAAKPFLDELGVAAPKAAVEVTFVVDNLVRIYSQEIEMAEAQAKMLADMPMMLPMPGIGEVMKKEYDLIFQGVREMVRMDVALSETGGRVEMPMTFTMKAGGDVAKAIAALTGRKCELVEYLPATSYFAMAYNMDPSAYEDWAELGVDFMVKMFELDEAAAKDLSARYLQSMALMTGDVAFSMYRDGVFGFAVDGLYGVTDGKKARENYYALYDMLWGKAIAWFTKAIEADGGQMPPKLDLSSFDKAIATLNPAIQPFGFGLVLKHEEYKGAYIDFVEVTVDYDKIPDLDPVSRGVLRETIGQKFELVLAFTDEFVFESFGPNAVARTKKAIDGDKPFAKAPSFAETRKAIDAGAGVFFVDAIQGAKALAMIPELAPMKPQIDALQPSGVFSVESRALASNQLELKFNVPLKPIADLMKLFGGM